MVAVGGGLDWGVSGRGWVHEGGAPVRTEAGTVGEGVRVRVTNPTTRVHVIAKLTTSGKERG